MLGSLAERVIVPLLPRAWNVPELLIVAVPEKLDAPSCSHWPVFAIVVVVPAALVANPSRSPALVKVRLPDALPTARPPVSEPSSLPRLTSPDWRCHRTRLDYWPTRTWRSRPS